MKETLLRWSNWELVEKCDPFVKLDAHSIHFDVTVPPDGTKKITYTVRYTWWRFVWHRTQTDFEIDTSRKSMIDACKIVVRNHKGAPQMVLIRENLFRWTTWKIEDSTDPYVKTNARPESSRFNAESARTL